MDFGRLETGERVLDLHVRGSRWIAESAQLSAFGEDFTSREGVDSEGDQDAAPGLLLVGEREMLAEGGGLLAMLGHSRERF